MPQAPVLAQQTQQGTPETITVNKMALYKLLNAIISSRMPQSWEGPGRVMFLKDLYGFKTFDECQAEWQKIKEVLSLTTW